MEERVDEREELSWKLAASFDIIIKKIL